MHEDLDPQLDLADQVHLLLRGHPAGCSEYQLIQQLKDRHSSHIPQLDIKDRLVLFRTHFLLFNALYRLRQRLLDAGQNQLLISPTSIRLMPLQSAGNAVGEQDVLASYYLDMDNLRNTTERDVQRLMMSFWSRMQGGDEKQAAIELFELDNSSEQLTLALIKQRYRQLVSLHHPDRGGSTTRLQSINKAMEILYRYYK
jgi:DnaJ-domain-containing protein 1